MVLFGWWFGLGFGWWVVGWGVGAALGWGGVGADGGCCSRPWPGVMPYAYGGAPCVWCLGFIGLAACSWFRFDFLIPYFPEVSQALRGGEKNVREPSRACGF